MDQYVGGIDSQVTGSLRKVAKKAKEAKIPSLAKMAEQDSELKDFLQFIHENGWRDKAAVLLKERLERQRTEILS